MALDYTRRRYRYREYRTRPLTEATEGIHILDDGFRIDVKTLELQGRGVLDLRFRPVFSIPVRYNDARRIFEIAKGGLPTEALIKGHFYGNTLPAETQAGDYTPALDPQHRLYVNDDQLRTIIDVKHAELYGADLTVAQEITLDTRASRLLEVYASASTATNFTLYVSTDCVNWISYKTYSATTEVKDTLWNGFRYVKLTSDPAGVVGDTVTLILSAK